MARSGIIYIDVAKAANQLQQDNLNPTVDAVRAILQTGSKSTIAPMLKEWKAKQEGLTTDIKAGVPPELLLVVKELYQRIQNEASVCVNNQKELFNKEIETIQNNLAQANELNSQQQLQINELTQDKDQLELHADNLISETNALKTKNTTLIAMNDQLIVQLTEKVSELERLVKQSEQVQANLEHYRESVSVQRVEERADFERERQHLDKSLRQISNENILFKQTNEQLNTKLTQLVEEKTALSGECCSVKEFNSKITSQLETMQSEHDSLNNEYRTKVDKLNQQNVKAAKLESQVSSDSETIARLTAKLEKSDENLESVQQDYSLVKQEKAQIQGQFQQLQRTLSKCV